MIYELSTQGLRGFGEKRDLKFAIPNGKEGSGMTIFVGPNNSGKTTIIEALRSFNINKDNPPSFSEKKRNFKSEEGKIHLQLKTDEGVFCIDTISSGGSSTSANKCGVSQEENWEGPRIFVLPSRRYVEYEFQKSVMERDEYLRIQQNNVHNRAAILYEFNVRLFKMQNNKEAFNLLLKQVLGYNLDWCIEQNDNGSYYLKINVNGHSHSSEGLGDGIWSVFTICDALYDSEPGSVIAIDEPELSLHPSFQKKILGLFKTFSQDRQIIISTHSPYFVDWDSLNNGAFLKRTVKNTNEDIDVFSLSDDSRRLISSFLININQPHILGTEAKEIFFLDDCIVLTEGQEDVVMYNKAIKEVGMNMCGSFFGWGAGGASNISKIAQMLKDLGYNKVVAIFDGDKQEERKDFETLFPEYKGFSISTDDIRDKEKVNKSSKKGLMTSSGKIKDEYFDEIRELFSSINRHLSNNVD